MSLTAVKAYFETRLDALNYHEWDDAFNIENIPDTLVDKAYHVEFNSISSSGTSHKVHEFDFPVTVRVFLKGFRDVDAAKDDAVVQYESILGGVLAPANRLGTAIKDIVPNNMVLLPIAQSNDNDIILEMTFTAKVMCVF